LLGLSPETFWGLTLRDLITKIDGFYKVREYNEELVRRATYLITMPYHKEGTKPSDLWTLASEQKQKQIEDLHNEAKAEKAFAKMMGL
jgi:hypothetical protein